MSHTVRQAFLEAYLLDERFMMMTTMKSSSNSGSVSSSRNSRAVRRAVQQYSSTAVAAVVEGVVAVVAVEVAVEVAVAVAGAGGDSASGLEYLHELRASAKPRPENAPRGASPSLLLFRS